MTKRVIIGVVLLVVVALIAASVWLVRPASAPVVGGVSPVATVGRPSTGLPAVASTSDIPIPPGRDPYALAQRLKLKSAAPVDKVVNPAPVSYEAGRQQSFWVTNVTTEQHFQVPATLKYVTPHLYVYLQDGVDVTIEDIRRSADDFENRVYSCVQTNFGKEWSPGVDNDVHLTVLATRGTGVAGYYSSSDELPISINPYSNQQELFFLDIGAVRFGSPTFVGVMAHEFQHMVHWNNDRDEQTWVNEGLSELSADFCGNGPTWVQAFATSPNTQLNAWASQPNAAGSHYGGAFLFFKYLAGRFGKESIRDLVQDPKAGIEGINSWLKRHDGGDFDSVFRDWVVANIVNDPAGGRFGYVNQKFTINPTDTMTGPEKRDARVRQLAANYHEIKPSSGNGVLKFDGSTTVNLIGAKPHSGNGLWWSNRSDGMDSTLTREIDLSSVSKATLGFWTWYDLERNWDFAYAEVSTDGGKTWDVLPGQNTTDANPVGNNYGVAWTGLSGGSSDAAWIQESVDLSKYAGKKVLLRFECVTDEAVNLEGFAIDDISIPEIGYADDAESVNGWQADGFVQMGTTAKQTFFVQVIRYGPETAVEEMTLDANQHGEISLRGFGNQLQRVVIVVSGANHISTRDASYTLTYEAAS